MFFSSYARRVFVPIVVALTCSLSLDQSARAQADKSELRMWHAATGGFKVEAELLDVRENKAQLRKSDGTTLWVPLDRLSLADVKFIQAELAKARQALGEGKDSDSQPNAKPQPQPSRFGARSSGKSDNKTDAGKPDAPTVDDLASVTPMEDADASGAEDGKEGGIDGKPVKSPFAGMRSTNLVLGQTSVHDMTFSDVFSPWVVIRKHGPKGSLLQLLNLRTGKQGEPFTVEGNPSAMALSPDGATLALGMQFPAKIVLYATASGKKGKEITVGDNVMLSALLFPAPGQLIVSSSFQGGAQVYDTKTGKQIRTIPIEQSFSHKKALSPDGRFLAVPGHSMVTIYDLKLGKAKAQLAVVPKDGSGSLSISELAFCSDGNELAVLCGGLASEFQVFSLKTSKPIVKHVLADRSGSLYVGTYKGPVIETIPDNKGYILYGCAIIDKENGGPVWVDKQQNGEPQSEFRVLIDDKRQLKLTGRFNAMRFEIVELPWSEIAKSKDTVAKGGTVEDAGLPAVKNVNAQTAKAVPKSLKPQLYEGKRLTDLPPMKAQAIPMDVSRNTLTGLRFASPASGKCISVPPLYSREVQREVVLFDLKKGQVEKTFDVGFISQITDLSPSGEWLVGTTGKSNDRVDIFNVKTGKHAVGFRPLGNEGSSAHSITNLKFLTDELLLTQLSRGEAIVWQIPELRAVYKLPAFSFAFRFPSSPLFIHRNEQGWCVRKAIDGEQVGMLEGTSSMDLDFLHSVQFRTDESACVGISGLGNDQRLIAWDLLTGKRIADISLMFTPVSRDLLSRDLISSIEGRRRFREEQILNKADSVSWAGDDQVLIRWQRDDQERFAQGANVSPTVYSLFSLKEGRVLWDYRLPMGIAFEGGPEGQIWFFEALKNRFALVSCKVPSDMATQQIDKAPVPKALLAAGDAAMVDIRVTVSGDKLADGLLQDQVSKVVQKNLASKNISISERASVKLSVLVDRVFVSNTGMRSTPQLFIHCRLTDISDNILWQREKLISTQAPQEDGEKTILADKVRRQQWDNALAFFDEAINPQTMVEKWYYRGLGESLLSSDEEKLIELRVK